MLPEGEGVQRLSEEIIAGQLSVPGTRVTEAWDDQGLLGAALWYQAGPYGYIHLHAQVERAYALHTSYVLYAAAMDDFAGQVRWLDFGGAAGVADDANDGLARFKRGWSTENRLTYVCGAVLNQAVYQALVDETETTFSGYFPAYRDPARPVKTGT